MSTSNRYGSLAAVIAVGILVAGCGGNYQTADHEYPPERPPAVQAPDARQPGQYHDDASITQRVYATVAAVPGVHANHLQISTYDGIVTLRGSASNETSARNAVQAARQVTGVRSIEYDMQVRSY